jgi:exodeoxyribonuclease VII small subunit
MAKRKAKSTPDSDSAPLVLTYQEAQQQLEQIVTAVENEELDVDQLSEQVQRAMELISFCRRKLKYTEESIQQAFDSDSEAG